MFSRFSIFLLASVFLTSCDSQTLFEQAENSGINFENKLIETEKENILTYEYFYNGGGVGAGDFNNDGLVDLFFTGNQTKNDLYLNQGQLKFKNISEASGIQSGKDYWSTGVSIVDINADGLLDVYVCNSGPRDSLDRKNQFFIHQGFKDGIPQFKDLAEEYGLADYGYSTQMAFLDYDHDGDLDAFLVNHNVSGYQRKEAAIMRVSYDYNAGDKLFRNEGSLEDPKFTEVSSVSAIKSNPLGFGLGVSVSDINQDGWSDIYVCNDFVEDDYIYINQKNGTFKEDLRSYLNHTSYSSMGVDIADINNDRRPDIMTTDMLPEDQARQKLLVWPDNWNVYQAQLQNGFYYANMRNMLHLNNGDDTFSEIGQFSGLSSTDWSWAVLLQDFDMDGYKDVFVSNGLGRDLTNIDFITYFNETESQGTNVLEQLKHMPNSKTKNFIFKNNGKLQFENKQKEWGFDHNTISNGVVTVDLDNDGDLEIVTNNLNEKSKIYKNLLQETSPKPYLKIKLKGEGGNLYGLGSKLIIQDSLYYEINPSTGYQSSQISDLCLPTINEKVEIKIIWPSGKSQKIYSHANQTLILKETEAKADTINIKEKSMFFEKDMLFPQIKTSIPDYNDFEMQILLPWQYSYFGPYLKTADLNQDGTDDLIVGGNEKHPSKIYLNKNSKWVESQSDFPSANVQSIEVVDFNKDDKPDLYFCIGAYRIGQNDQLWLNQGRGRFTKAFEIPDQAYNKSVVIEDFDLDKDLDILVIPFFKPLQYPISQPSLLFINHGQGRFSTQPQPDLGLVTQIMALGNRQFVAIGEWMPPTLFHLDNNKMIVDEAIAPELEGWWNTINAADLDGDGDKDLILGNLGQNFQFTADEKHPASLYYSDFDENSRVDAFMDYYVGSQPYPPYSRDEVGEQIPMLRKKFVTYADFAKAPFEHYFSEEKLNKAKKKQIKEIRSLILRNDNKQFTKIYLPLQAQFSPINAILIKDINSDNRPDLITVGNNSKYRLRMGKVDANFGQLYLNRGEMTFEYIPCSGLQIKGDAKSIISIGSKIFIGINGEGIQAYDMKVKE